MSSRDVEARRRFPGSRVACVLLGVPREAGPHPPGRRAPAQGVALSTLLLRPPRVQPGTAHPLTPVSKPPLLPPT